MANDFSRSVHVGAPADEVWALVGDPASVADWFPPITSCVVEGDERRVVTAQGVELTERLLDRDEAGRSYSYAVVAGNPLLTSHRATLSVSPDGAGSVVTWRQQATSDAEGFDLERRLGRVVEEGLAALAGRFPPG